MRHVEPPLRLTRRGRAVVFGFLVLVASLASAVLFTTASRADQQPAGPPPATLVPPAETAMAVPPAEAAVAVPPAGTAMAVPPGESAMAAPSAEGAAAAPSVEGAMAVPLAEKAVAVRPGGPGSADGSVVAPPVIVVRSGDTLWDIASREMPGRDGQAAVAELRRLNGLAGYGVRAGDVLILPVAQ